MIKNLTPHKVVIKLWDREIVLPPEGIIPRVKTIEEDAEPIDGIPCVKRKLSEVEYLPPKAEGTFYLVSSLVFEACDRDDLVCPDTGKTCIRDAEGRILAVTRLIRKEKK